MKRIIYSLLAVSMTLVSCVTRMNLEDIDLRAEVKTGVGVPVATVTAKLGQILQFDSLSGQTNKVAQLYFKMPGDNTQPDDIADYTLFFRDTFAIERSFHTININSYRGTSLTNMNIAQQMGITASSYTIPAGTSLTLMFPLVVNIDSINDDINTERVDSILVDTASYISKFTTDFGLTDADVQKVELVYPSNITDFNGVAMPDQPLDIHVGQDCEIPMYNIAISMKQDPTKPGWESGNSLKQMTFNVRFTLKTSQPLTISQTSHIDYQFDVQYLSYKAVWGYFDPSKYMRFNEEYNLDELWSGWQSLRNLKMRLSKPFLKLIVEHSIAANLDVNIHSLYTNENATSVRHYALFGTGTGDTTTVWHMTNYADPITSEIGTRATNEVTYYYTGHNPNEHEGDLDRLFDQRPNIIGFNIDITTHDGRNAVYRLDKNPYIHVSAVATVPFIVNEGSELSYSDTIDLDLSKYSYDSIIGDVEWLDTLKEANVKLYIKAKNGIPFAIDAEYQFLDKNLNVVDMNVVSNDNNAVGHVLHISAPTKFDNRGIAIEPGTGIVIISVSAENWKRLQSIRHIRYEAKISGNPTTAAITSDAELQLMIGIGANVDAIINTEAFINKNKEED